MSESVLRVAMIGVGGFGRATVEALAGVDCVELVGVADRNGKAAAQIGQDFGVRSYTDNRSVLAETGPEAVFLAVPPMVAPDLVAECAKRGIHVWRELPLGRNLDEAVSLMRLMDQAKLKFAVGTQRRFASSYRRAWQLRRKLGQTFLGRSHYLFNWGPELGWRSDKTSAGGGALLELGYPAVDLLIWMLGLPEEVYGINSCGYRPAHNDSAPTTTPYDTDDTAAVILRYKDGCMASVVTTRSSGPVSEELVLHGRGGSVTANPDLCLLRDPDGNVLDRLHNDLPPIETFRRQAESFVQAVLADAKIYECSARENILTQSVIESAYLSDRTSQPERPGQMLHTLGLKPADCLAYRPPELTNDDDLPME